MTLHWVSMDIFWNQTLLFSNSSFTTTVHVYATHGKLEDKDYTGYYRFPYHVPAIHKHKINYFLLRQAT